MNFWQQLVRPFFTLAPMADVTDAAFRRIIAKYSAHERTDGSIGGPDVMWTEFVSADGLVLAPEEGRQKLLADLKYSEEERPIVAQLFSATPEHMEKAARLCRKLGFDGIDINMGCPDRSVEKQGCGAAMIKDSESAQEVIRAAKRGGKDLPVSVKTRIGYNTDVLEEWLSVLLEETPAAVTIHGRTRKEMSKVSARWERVKRAVEIRNEMKSDALIIGNGDVVDLEDAHRKASLSGADGIMLGRAIFGRPFLFFNSRELENKKDRNVREKVLRIMVEHTQLFEELLPHKNFAVMKKHYKAYASGFIGARELRIELMQANNAKEVAQIIDNFLASGESQVAT